MNIGHLSRPARRFLSERLDRLHEALENLGQRLREGISQLVGSHIGDAVRDALASALPYKPQPRPVDPYRAHDLPDHGYPSRDGSGTRQDFWHDPEYELEPPEPEPTIERRPRRWQPLLTGGVQLASWWIQHRPTPRSLKRMLAISAVAGLTTVLAGPLIGSIVMVAGTAFQLTRMADTATNTAGKAAEATAP